MTFASAFELLEALLREEAPSGPELVALLGSKAAGEGLYLDFKNGEELNKPKKNRNFTLRQYVAAFANSEGGVLMIGIEDKTKALAPITLEHEGKVGGDLKGWAASAVADLTGYLGVPPRFQTVDVTGGKVLMVAVARAPTLVPLQHEGRIKHFFRIEDEAREVPSSLVADLVLGRRKAPFLTITSKPWALAKYSEESVRGGSRTLVADVVEPDVWFVIANDSLVTAVEARAGLLAWSFTESDALNNEHLSQDLRSRIELEEPNDAQGHPHHLRHFRLEWSRKQTTDRGVTTLKPFDDDSASIRTGPKWSFGYGNQRKQQVSAALYILPEGGEPLWFEVKQPVYGLTIRNAVKRPVRPVDATTCQPAIERVVGRRPLVSLFASKGTE